MHKYHPLEDNIYQQTPFPYIIFSLRKHPSVLQPYLPVKHIPLNRFLLNSTQIVLRTIFLHLQVLQLSKYKETYKKKHIRQYQQVTAPKKENQDKHYPAHFWSANSSMQFASYKQSITDRNSIPGNLSPHPTRMTAINITPGNLQDQTQED